MQGRSDSFSTVRSTELLKPCGSNAVGTLRLCRLAAGSGCGRSHNRSVEASPTEQAERLLEELQELGAEFRESLERWVRQVPAATVAQGTVPF